MLHFSHEQLQHAVGPLFCSMEAVNRSESLLTYSIISHLGRLCMLLRVVFFFFAIYNPWIVLAAIYTVHSEKQETFWLHWAYSVCTIPWEEVFPPFSQADADRKQGHTTEIPLKQQDIRAKTHFSLLGVVITKAYVECFNFMSLSS